MKDFQSIPVRKITSIFFGRKLQSVHFSKRSGGPGEGCNFFLTFPKPESIKGKIHENRRAEYQEMRSAGERGNKKVGELNNKMAEWISGQYKSGKDIYQYSKRAIY